MTKLPMLARIHVATPCHADWAQMTGDERVRHCAHCKKDVFNLSDLSREQAERVIIEKNGDLCARYFQRNDGTILLADCSVGIRQKRKTRVLAAGAAMLLAGTGGAAGYLKLRHVEKVEAVVDRPHDAVMGLVAVDPPPVPEVTPSPDVHEVKGEMILRQAPTPPEPVHMKMGKIKAR